MKCEFSVRYIISGDMATIEHHLPQVLRNVVLEYLPDRELLPWINEDDLIWYEVSRNPSAIHLLEANQDKIDWYELSRNPSAIHLLEANQDKISWCELSRNPAAMHLIEANQDKIDWYTLGRNPSAENLIKDNLKKILIYDLMRNPVCFHYCVDHPDEWFDKESGLTDDIWALYKNPGDEAFGIMYKLSKCLEERMFAHPLAIQYLNLYPPVSTEDWKYLSKNPMAIDVLQNNPDKINWYKLSANPAAIHLLEANQDKIDWHKFSINPGICPIVPKSEIDALL